MKNQPSNLLTKVLSLYVRIKHGDISSLFRYYYRDTYYCKIMQLKYFFQDYVFKKKYKTISFHGEFAPELQFGLPFAYWHYKNGTLKETISSKYTKELYFFSPNHKEEFDLRTNLGNYNYELPRILYSHDYDMKKWAQVPLKKTYKNDFFVYDKPILIIANRYNSEWDGPPISFYSVEILSKIIDKLKNIYTIIYNRAGENYITNDNSDIYDLDEFDWLKKEHSEVLLMQDLYKRKDVKVNNYNHLQLMVYANSDCFISIHGGTATLASYFGGTNIILSKQGPEHHFNCYQELYPKLSGAKIIHVKHEEEVLHKIDEEFLSN